MALASQPAAIAELRARLERMTAHGGSTAGALPFGVETVDGDAPFVLFTVGDAALVRKHLHAKGIAVRRCDTFTGLGGHYLRAAVRPEQIEFADRE